MLSYILAIAVGLASLSLYLATFFVPHVHRKDDLILSGLGLFYALVLWTCAGRITGGVLLGQVAGVTLLGWFMWETVSLRGILAKPDPETVISATTQAKIEELSFGKLFEQITHKFNKKPLVPSSPTASIAVETPTENINEVDEISTVETQQETQVTPTSESVTEISQALPQDGNFVPETEAETVIQEQTVITQTLEETEETEETEVTPTLNLEPPAKKGFSFSNLITGIFGKKKESVKTTKVVSEEETTDQELIAEATEAESLELELEESSATVIQTEEPEEPEELTTLESTPELETVTTDEPETTAEMVAESTETLEGELEETPAVIEENTQNQLPETEDIITVEASSVTETEETPIDSIETESKKSEDQEL
jgi:hypothetical protein